MGNVRRSRGHHAACGRRCWRPCCPTCAEEWGNPSSLYGPGRRAAQAVDQAAPPSPTSSTARAEEIVFTARAAKAPTWRSRASAERPLAGKRHLDHQPHRTPRRARHLPLAGRSSTASS